MQGLRVVWVNANPQRHQLYHHVDSCIWDCVGFETTELVEYSVNPTDYEQTLSKGYGSECECESENQFLEAR